MTYMSDYGTVHLLHWLRNSELERERRGILFGFTGGETRPNRLIMRVQRLMRHRRLATAGRR